MSKALRRQIKPDWEKNARERREREARKRASLPRTAAQAYPLALPCALLVHAVRSVENTGAYEFQEQFLRGSFEFMGRITEGLSYAQRDRLASRIDNALRRYTRMATTSDPMTYLYAVCHALVRAADQRVVVSESEYVAAALTLKMDGEAYDDWVGSEASAVACGELLYDALARELRELASSK